jgi:hypothetical protein
VHRRLAAACLVLGALRTGAGLVAEPLAAYADNTDTLRTMAVFGLRAEDGSAFATPTTRWVPGDGPANAWPSSELVVTGLAIAAERPFTPVLHARVRGAVAGALLLGLVAWLVARLRGVAGVGLAVFYAAVLCDPVHTLWNCTLYAESTALLGLVAAIGGLTLLAREDSRAAKGVAIGGLLVLGLSRMAHLVLPAALCVAAGVPAGRRRAVWAAALGVPVAWLAWRLVADTPYTRAVHLANGVDTLLGLWLPRSADPAGALTWLLGGRAARDCVGFLGEDWYTPGLQQNLACTGIAALRTRALLPVLWAAEPTLLPRVAWDLLPETRPWTMTHLGHGGGASGLSRAVLALPDLVYRAGWVGLVALGLWRREARLAAVASVTVYLSCLVGDGRYELAKHAQLLQATGPWLLGCAIVGALTFHRRSA